MEFAQNQQDRAWYTHHQARQKCPATLTKNLEEDEVEINVDHISPAVFHKAMPYAKSCGAESGMARKKKLVYSSGSKPSKKVGSSNSPTLSQDNGCHKCSLTAKLLKSSLLSRTLYQCSSTPENESTQCAAVSTMSGAISDPPHTCDDGEHVGSTRDTAYGHLSLGAMVPPIIQADGLDVWPALWHSNLWPLLLQVLG
eukprot:1229155-Ditylum_brightwellii.AAC.1